MDLTDEQEKLLRAIVKVYNAGCTSEFILNRTMDSGSSLIYSGHASVSIDADESDFEILADNKLISIGRTSQGSLRGKTDCSRNQPRGGVC